TVWQREIGQGFSSPVVQGDILILFHRVASSEVLEAVRMANAAPLWRSEYPSAYRDDFGFDEGPRATPTIAAGKVFTFGAEGMLSCVDLKTGQRQWSVNTKDQF